MALIVLRIACFLIQHQLPSRLTRVSVDLDEAPLEIREELEDAFNADGRIAIMAPGQDRCHPYN